jgi:hypothetical protein
MQIVFLILVYNITVYNITVYNITNNRYDKEYIYLHGI